MAKKTRLGQFGVGVRRYAGFVAKAFNSLSLDIWTASSLASSTWADEQTTSQVSGNLVTRGYGTGTLSGTIAALVTRGYGASPTPGLWTASGTASDSWSAS